MTIISKSPCKYGLSKYRLFKNRSAVFALHAFGLSAVNGFFRAALVAAHDLMIDSNLKRIFVCENRASLIYETKHIMGTNIGRKEKLISITD